METNYSMELNPLMKATPRNLLGRLTPLKEKVFHEDFKGISNRLQRPYYRLSEANYEAVKKLSGESDVLLLDGKTQVTFGEADGGLALMPLYRPI